MSSLIRPEGLSVPKPCTQAKTILYISEIYPINTHASSVVVYRHLSSLEKKGFRILLILPENRESSNHLPSSWDRILLPPRRFFYPPYRQNSFLKAVRWILIYYSIRHRISKRHIHCIIGMLYGRYLMYFTSWLAKRLSVPFCLFYHDQAELLDFSLTAKDAQLMRRQNLELLASPQLRRVWLASPELRYEENKDSSIYTVLYPLPESISIESRAIWRDAFSSRLSLVYAGALYDQVVPVLKLVCAALRESGGKLVIFTKLRENAMLLFREFPEIVEYRGHVSNDIFYQYLAKNATGFLVTYPEEIESMPWCLNCFPSKFVQLVHTGLPGIILSPKGTSIALWCEKHDYTLFSTNYSIDSIAALISRIRNEITWRSASHESLLAASSDFDPIHIESQFNDEILALHEKRSPIIAH